MHVAKEKHSGNSELTLILMELVEHMSQMLVVSFIVHATNEDVITNVLDTGYTSDCVTHFLLENFCTKIETLVAKQPNMSGELSEQSRITVERNLVVPLIKINLAKCFTPIEVCQHIVKGRNDSFVEEAHVYTDCDFVWLQWLWYNHNQGHPRCWAFSTFNDAIALKLPSFSSN